MPKQPDLPVVPIKNSILFPNLLMPLSVGRPNSIAAIQAAMASETKEIIVVTQRDSSVEIPGPADLFPMATRAVIKRSGRSGDKFEILVLGVERVALDFGDASGTDDFLRANYRPAPIPEEPAEDNPEIEALQREVAELASKVLEHTNLALPSEFARTITGQSDPLQLAWMMASVLNMDLKLEYSLLAVESAAEALRLIHAQLSHEVQILEIRGKIATKAKNEMGK